MNKNKTSTIKQKLTSLYRNAVSLSLGAGILLASTHSSALGSNYGLSPVDFKVKVVGAELWVEASNMPAPRDKLTAFRYRLVSFCFMVDVLFLFITANSLA
jgi:hypothetical protein